MQKSSNTETTTLNQSKKIEIIIEDKNNSSTPFNSNSKSILVKNRRSMSTNPISSYQNSIILNRRPSKSVFGRSFHDTSMLSRPSICLSSLSKPEYFKYFRSNPRLNSFYRRHSLAYSTKFNTYEHSKSKLEMRNGTLDDDDFGEDKKSPFPKISVVKNANNNLKFGSILSTTGQCALLKAYEDELYNQIRNKYPKTPIPRISTCIFNSRVNHENKQKLLDSSTLISLDTYSSNSLIADSNVMTTHDMTDKSTISVGLFSSSKNNLTNPVDDLNKLRINKQIDDAMQILDEIGKEKLFTKPKFNAELEENSKMKDIVRKYERWQKRWSRMFDEMF